MGRIVFLNYFSKDECSGGIKTTYHHAALLRAQGFDAKIFQPDGVPSWLNEKDWKNLVCQSISLEKGDVVVYPEILEGWYEQAIRAPIPAKKVIFCQNPYYFFWHCHSRQELEEWGVEHLIVSSEWAKKSVQSVLGIDNVDVIPPCIDMSFFVPREKKMCIASAAWKWGGVGHLPPYDRLIFKIFRRKYPSLSSVPWIPIEGMPEQKVADTMGEATVCMALGRMEALGITALEAMASECLVVGFRGGGGLEYATSQNGFWHSPEEIEEVADSLALALELTSSNSQIWQRMRYSAKETARAYSQHKTEHALCAIYGLCMRAVQNEQG